MSQLTLPALLAGTGRSLRRAPVTSLLVLGLLTAGGVAIDLSGASLGNIAINLATLVAELLVLRRVLAAAGLASARQGGSIVQLFGLGIVAGLPILLGFLLLVLPGWFLAARWAIAAPVLIGERQKIDHAMRESWRRTRGQVVPLGLALLIVFAPTLAGIALTLFLPAFDPRAGFALDVAVNALLCLGQLAGWHLAVAAYLLLGGATSPLGEVFA